MKFSLLVLVVKAMPLVIFRVFVSKSLKLLMFLFGHCTAKRKNVHDHKISIDRLQQEQVKCFNVFFAVLFSVMIENKIEEKERENT